MATVCKPWAVVLVVAVLSRLMSTDGRSLRVQQRQQLLERAGYQNPELDIDRAYELMNEKRDRRQHRPHLQQSLKPAVTANDDNDGGVVGKELHLTSDAQPLGSAAGAAVDGRPVAGVPSVHVTAAASRNVTSTGSIHSPEPKYHYEVHSVQHNPDKYNTAELKLRAVVRQAAAAENRLARNDDGVKEALIDDSEHHNQRLLAARKTRTEGKDQKSSASKERHFLEQIRHLEDERDQEAGEDDADDDYEQLLEQEVNGDRQSNNDLETAVVRVRVDQNAEGVKESEPAEPASAVGGDGTNGNGVALPLVSAGNRHDEWGTMNGARSASSIADIYFLAVVIGCSIAGIAGFLFAGLCWYRLHKKMKAASEVDYPAYGVTGPVTASAANTKGSSGGVAGSPVDRKLAQSAQMYHYVHQKQQMIAAERLGGDVNQHVGGTGSDVESEEENEDGDYTVFECPGLATNGEMEVRNPMFSDPTPVGTPADASGLYPPTKK